MANQVIEISGPDYVGKSTQAGLLNVANQRFSHNFGGFGSFGDKFPKHLSPQEQWKWWFRDTDLRTLGGAIIGAYNNRLIAASRSELDMVIVERGERMCRAQLAANFATRREVQVSELVEEVDAFVDAALDMPGEVPVEEFYLASNEGWLERSASVRSHVRTFHSSSGGYTPAENEFYRRYHQNLGYALEVYGSADKDRMHRIEVDQCAVTVQNRIRSHDAISELALPEVFSGEHVFIGLAGLSECGKSRVAAELEHNHRFIRLKLGFFNELARDESRYADPGKIAGLITGFLANNRHITRASFESLHSPPLASTLKLMLGDKWKTVYLETAPEIRAQRAVAEYPEEDPAQILRQQQAKDAVKRSADVEAHSHIADLVLSNDGPINATINALLKGVSGARD